MSDENWCMDLIQKYKRILGMRAAGNFECGGGWEKIIADALKAIDIGYDPLKEDNPVVHIIKEKYGGLRIQGSNFDKRMQDAIDKAEKLSFKTCEHTGKPGHLYSVGNKGETGFGGWLMTLNTEFVKSLEADPDNTRQYIPYEETTLAKGREAYKQAQRMQPQDND